MSSAVSLQKQTSGVCNLHVLAADMHIRHFRHLQYLYASFKGDSNKWMCNEHTSRLNELCKFSTVLIKKF